MIGLNTFRINLKEAAASIYYIEDKGNLFLESRKKLFIEMTERVLNYKNDCIELPWKADESKFEKKYLIMNKDNVVLSYLEKYQIADETLREKTKNHCTLIFADEIAEAEVELENIIIDVYSASPLENFAQDFYRHLVHGVYSKNKK
jgi:hypothetical protein